MTFMYRDEIAECENVRMDLGEISSGTLRFFWDEGDKKGEEGANITFSKGDAYILVGALLAIAPELSEE